MGGADFYKAISTLLSEQFFILSLPFPAEELCSLEGSWWGKVLSTDS